MTDELLRQALAPFLHKAQLANAVTGFATCLAGIVPLWYCLVLRGQPARWVFVYLCVLVTGIPTVWFHAYEDNMVAASTDVGSNILLAWAMQLAVSGDFMRPRPRALLIGVTGFLTVCAWAWLVHEAMQGIRKPLITFGDFGQFYPGEIVLILNSVLVTVLFLVNVRGIPPHARPLLFTVIGMFLIGAFLAGADNDEVALRVFSWHAVWHLWGAFALVTLWLFNHVRFNEEAPDTRRPPG